MADYYNNNYTEVKYHFFERHGPHFTREFLTELQIYTAQNYDLHGNLKSHLFFDDFNNVAWMCFVKEEVTDTSYNFFIRMHNAPSDKTQNIQNLINDDLDLDWCV